MVTKFGCIYHGIYAVVPNELQVVRFLRWSCKAFWFCAKKSSRNTIHVISNLNSVLSPYLNYKRMKTFSKSIYKMNTCKISLEWISLHLHATQLYLFACCGWPNKHDNQSPKNSLSLSLGASTSAPSLFFICSRPLPSLRLYRQIHLSPSVSLRLLLSILSLFPFFLLSNLFLFLPFSVSPPPLYLGVTGLPASR